MFVETDGMQQFETPGKGLQGKINETEGQGQT
jgi:uncharacterized protein (DUF4415 family)